MYGTMGVFECAAGAGHLYWAFIAGLCDPGDEFCANFAEPDRPAQRTWWQRDHKLTGLGIARTEAESHWDALRCAQRGRLEHLEMTVWFDRGSHPTYVPQYRFFRRGPRHAEVAFRPATPEITREQLIELLKKQG